MGAMTAQSKMGQLLSAPRTTTVWNQQRLTVKLRRTLVQSGLCQFIQTVAKFSPMVAILVTRPLKDSMMEIHSSVPKSSAKILESHFVWHITIEASASNGLMAATLVRFLIQFHRPGIAQKEIAMKNGLTVKRFPCQLHTVEFQKKANPNSKIFSTLGILALKLVFNLVWVFWWLPIFWLEKKDWYLIKLI